LPPFWGKIILKWYKEFFWTRIFNCTHRWNRWYIND
jgi:hypothetical protein